MRNTASGIAHSYRCSTLALGSIGSLALLRFRIWVALAFWRAGVVKLDDPIGTAFLFHNAYHVPLLSGDVAAFLGTWIELITPWFLLLGLGGRITAGFLSVYNLMAVLSYFDLWPHGFWAGLVGSDFSDHKAWAMMLLAVVAWGPGALSIDHLLILVWPGAAARMRSNRPVGLPARNRHDGI